MLYEFLRIKAKVYFTLYAYMKDSVQCAWRKFHHQNSTHVLYAARTPGFWYAQVAHAH